MDHAKRLLPDGVPEDAYAAAKDADALVVVTEWDEFRGLDLDRSPSRCAAGSWSTFAMSTTVRRPKKPDLIIIRVGRGSAEGNLVRA